MGRFAEVLSELKVPSEEFGTLTIQQTLEKYPKLDEAVLRQDEFSRQMESHRRQIAERDEKITDWDARLKTWENYFNAAGGWDPEAGMTKREAQAIASISQRDARIRELEAGQGADMTFEQVEEQLKKKGYISRDDLKAVLPDSVFGMEADGKTPKFVKALEDRVNKQGLAFEYMFGKGAEVLAKYQKEFEGEIPNMQEFLRFAQENDDRLKDITGKAYEEWVAPKRLAVEKAKLEADRKKLEDDRKAAEAAATHRSPTDQGQGGNAQPMSKFAERLLRDRANKPEDSTVEAAMKTPLGSGFDAQVAADILEKEGTLVGKI